MMWCILAGSLAALPFQRRLALLLGTIALGWACLEGVVDLRGVVALGIILLIARVKMHATGHSRVLTAGGEILLVIAALALLVHQIPGFYNPRILDDVQAGTHSAPFTLYFNFDKALMPFVLLAALPTLLFTRSDYHPKCWQWLLLILSMPVLLMVAMLLGALKIELHFPSWLGSFMLANLFFVSFAEEALFRGYLQQRLAGWLGNLPALFIAALIFGLAHIGGGLLLVVFASMAGLIYGLAWMWSGRLWVSTLCHFALNMCHLLVFTYPIYWQG
jgi:membrane protease YdiL (CAAX protease family)